MSLFTYVESLKVLPFWEKFKPKGEYEKLASPPTYLLLVSFRLEEILYKRWNIAGSHLGCTCVCRISGRR